MKWSERADANLTPNRLTEAAREVRAAGRSIVDLTLSNPTHAGFDYPADLLAPLADARALEYNPDPLGLVTAREAVAADYARRQIAVRPDRIILAASTSDAYSLLFKLLCDPGDEVLVPRPSYPLFEHLARLDAVASRGYQLEYHGAWSIDFESIDRSWSPRTRAILAVSPNNPTGSFIKPAELARLSTLAAARGAAVIVDEVFADYELTDGAAAASGCVLDQGEVLAFSLGGLSKSIGLPQAKLAWMGVSGPDLAVESAMSRLEFVADTYLSVSTPVQTAAADLLTRGAAVRTQIHNRIRKNYAHLLAAGRDVPACGVLDSEGGWYAVLRVPSLMTEEELVVRLLTADGVLTHPGYFFDFPSESYLVISLIVPEVPFGDGVARVLRHFHCSVPHP